MMLTHRPLTPEDLDLVCRHRAAMFRDAGRREDAIAAMAAPFRHWLAPRLADGRYFGFVLHGADGMPVAGIGLMELDWPPHPAHPQDGRRGYVLNVYVEPSHRRQGLARRLMDLAETEFRGRGVTYTILHATAAGRPLYEQAGWAPTTEMAKALA
ncbi:GNAT family N-acetyltransferase [Nitrospirillum iridis]|uniref:Ribosomal protein S18 acetylase RimI-like enzyme n=1 Tax=Nitrospirillum iridis TaxID=765888 RepID=A0A7X0B1U9_9PROT|nr:GNAT family N-acetyltransferase [Nitrospirillum iridis]MBB6252831.1 ribosomal protein S18 acetylase RimI-like enzyme [Nitrospirillum iridis]